jgi:hypothetical protein
MISRENLVKRLCSEFNVDPERVDQNNIDTILRWLNPSYSSPLTVEEIIWWIKDHGLKTGLKVFVIPGYRHSFLRFRVRNDIYGKRKSNDIESGGLLLKHITGYYKKLIPLGIESVDDICEKSACDLYRLIDMNNYEVMKIQENLKYYGRSLKESSKCCKNRPTT